MKIAHVENGRHLYGGAQQVLYIAAGLAGHGVDSFVVCTPDSAIAPLAREHGIRVAEVPCAGDADLRFVWRLRRLLAEERPDIVHCHSRRGADFMGGQAAAMAGIPAIVSRRVATVESGMLAALRYRKFRHVIAISEAIEQILLDAGVARDKLSMIRSAVDAERFANPAPRSEFCREFGVDPAATIVICAGQLIPRKGHQHLMTALAALKPRYPALRVLLFGKGAGEAEEHTRVSALGLEDIVSFEGFRDDLDAWMGGADLLVHPALSEGLGVTVLKAQASGVAVIASAVDGLREVVVHGETGLLVPPADPAALTDAMATLIDDTELRERYAEAARERVMNDFSIPPMVMAHLRLYESILDE